MAYSCKIEADSISVRGHRLTTMVVTMPRIILAEFNTHRAFSRNSASSRAIPVRTYLERLLNDPFIPVEFGTVDKGMNAGPALSGDRHNEAVKIWADAQVNAIESALMLTTSREYIVREWERWTDEKNDDYTEFVLSLAVKLAGMDPEVVNDAMLRVSKGQTNRLLEPFSWQEVVVTGTEYTNFFNLRTDRNAQLEIRTAAEQMEELYEASTPTELQEGEWHLPFIQPDEQQWAKDNLDLAIKSSVARCARVSYLTHDRKKVDQAADIRLADSLAVNGHMSPYEHAATPFSEYEWWVRHHMASAAKSKGFQLEDYVLFQLIESTQFALNFRGWASARRSQKNQSVFQSQDA
jgi:thymidylate synthase ThyX